MRGLGFTHKGLVRKKNEARYVGRMIADGSILLAVADGMGGEARGEYAAEIMRRKLVDLHPNHDNKEKLVNLVVEADLVLSSEVDKNPALEGMGTTVTAVLLRNGNARWVHVGDSRLYLWRAQRLIQVTKDQNMAQFLLEEGEITEEEARIHPSRNLLDQCVGCGECEPETGRLKVKSGDLILLTTDGLHGEISLETMTSILASPANIETKARSLIQAALDAGGRDNITVVIAET